MNSLLSSDWQVNALLFSSSNLSGWAQGVIEVSTAPSHYDLDPALLAKLSSKHDSSELMALVAMKAPDINRIDLATPPLLVVLDRPSNPGNLGTIIRSCDAFAATALLLTGHAADLYDPKTLAATTGSFFVVDAHSFASHQAVVPLFERIRTKYGAVQLVGSSANAPTSLYALDFTLPTVLLIGNEEKGLSHVYTSLANTIVTIPMRAKAASSLNVAVATSIFLAEARRQRG